MNSNSEKEKIELSISGSPEADRKLLSHLPFLLQDMWGMGSSVDDIIDVVGGLALPVDQRS